MIDMQKRIGGKFVGEWLKSIDSYISPEEELAHYLYQEYQLIAEENARIKALLTEDQKRSVIVGEPLTKGQATIGLLVLIGGGGLLCSAFYQLFKWLLSINPMWMYL